MTPIEFRYKFDVLFNNIMSNAAPGLDDYEVSQFLTKAQLELVKDYFNPNGNKYREGFDGSAKRQADFSALIQSDALSPIIGVVNQFDERSVVYEFPKKFVAILNEVIELYNDGVTYRRHIVPISYTEYSRLMSKPYKEPLKNQAWRLLTGQGDNNIAEIVLTTQDKQYDSVYKVRYVRMPRPIIVSDLNEINNSISIDGETAPRTSELNPELHEEILQRAVEIAKASYSSDQSGQAQMQNQIAIGERSE